MFPADPIDFLLSLERLGMKFGLANMQALCGALGHPERVFPSVLIAGTNGKGSVAAMVSTACDAAGYRCGRYTSPHLVRLEERFVIGGREITRTQLAASAGRVKAAVEALLEELRLETPPTFFECTTAVAFDLFQEADVDLAVLEVGLGGRLDATNVVTPLVTAITSIAFDHEAQLGHTLDAIAREKAGIIEPRVPVICGPLPEEALHEVRTVAGRAGSPVLLAGDLVRLDVIADDGRMTVDVASPRRALKAVTLGLRGRHQLANAAVAVAILDQLEDLGWRVSDAAVRVGLADVRWPARLERFTHQGLDVLVDAAHNPAGAAALAGYLEGLGWEGITLVFGAMQDKNVRGMLEPLLPLCGRLVCTMPPTPRALAAEDLARLAGGIDAAPAIAIVPDPADALEAAVRAGAPIVIAGSIFLAGPLRDILR